mmetsp:Transcript_46612/g.72961  ORF Transcript_46612/g.72961 Transcript_46612/m.72961 type:complete len:134 (+) Transcript_46612:433-834(+)
MAAIANQQCAFEHLHMDLSAGLKDCPSIPEAANQPQDPRETEPIFLVLQAVQWAEKAKLEANRANRGGNNGQRGFTRTRSSGPSRAPLALGVKVAVAWPSSDKLKKLDETRGLLTRSCSLPVENSKKRVNSLF